MAKNKPKQYTHIDYEALLIQAMKERKSIEQCLEENNLQIARSTVIRNIRKMKENGNNPIIDLYEEQYVPNMQKKKLPENLEIKILDLQSKPVVLKDELDDLYKKLSLMKQIVESCNGNIAEAARIISTGDTVLGNVKISTQGLNKNMKYYEKVKQAIIERKDKEQEEEEKE